MEEPCNIVGIVYLEKFGIQTSDVSVMSEIIEFYTGGGGVAANFESS